MSDHLAQQPASPLDPAENPAVIAHLNMLQAVITRLAGNSAQCKTWCRDRQRAVRPRRRHQERPNCRRGNYSDRCFRVCRRRLSRKREGVSRPLQYDRRENPGPQLWACRSLQPERSRRCGPLYLGAVVMVHLAGLSRPHHCVCAGSAFGVIDVIRSQSRSSGLVIL